MSEVRPILDDEVDLFEFFQILWDGKWLISAFVAIATALGGGFLAVKDISYESKLNLIVAHSPPLYSNEHVINKFKEKFFSVNLFEDWKQNKSNAALVFEDFSPTVVVDGFIFLKSENGQLVTLLVDKEGAEISLLIKSNQFDKLYGLYEYVVHINGLLTDEFAASVKEQLEIVESRAMVSTGFDFGSLLFSMQRFVSQASKSEFVFKVDRPTLPKKITPEPSLVLATFAVAGGMLGAFFVFFLNAIAKRKGAPRI